MDYQQHVGKKVSFTWLAHLNPRVKGVLESATNDILVLKQVTVNGNLRDSLNVFADKVWDFKVTDSERFIVIIEPVMSTAAQEFLMAYGYKWMLNDNKPLKMSYKESFAIICSSGVMTHADVEYAKKSYQYDAHYYFPKDVNNIPKNTYKINNLPVEINVGSVKIGCKTIQNKVLNQILEYLMPIVIDGKNVTISTANRTVEYDGNKFTRQQLEELISKLKE